MNFFQRASIIFFVFLIVPSIALATDVNLQLNISGEFGGSGGTGSGGGGGQYVTTQTHSISGWSSPLAYIEAVVNDRVVTSVTAGTNGSFTINVSIPNGASVILRSTDSFGTQTILNQPIIFNAGSTAPITNVIMPPSINLPTTNPLPGETIIGSGHTIPGAIASATLTASNNESITSMLTVDASGNFSIFFETKNLSLGAFVLQISVNYSGNSAVTTINGTIGKTVILPPAGCRDRADLNCDGNDNLQDVSILLSYFKKQNFPARYDLNNDGKINLIDFSIMLYYLGNPVRTTLTASTVETASGVRPTLMMDVGRNIDGDWVAAFSTNDDGDEPRVQISTDAGKNFHSANSPYLLGDTEPERIILRATDSKGRTSELEYRSTPVNKIIWGAAIGALLAIIIILILNLKTRRHA